MIRLKRIYEPVAVEDCCPVPVDRLRPRGVREAVVMNVKVASRLLTILATTGL